MIEQTGSIFMECEKGLAAFKSTLYGNSRDKKTLKNQILET